MRFYEIPMSSGIFFDRVHPKNARANWTYDAISKLQYIAFTAEVESVSKTLPWSGNSGPHYFNTLNLKQPAIPKKNQTDGKVNPYWNRDNSW